MKPLATHLPLAAVIGGLLIGTGASAQTALGLPAALENLSNAPDWQNADAQFANAVQNLQSAQAAAGLQVTGGSQYDFSKNVASSADPTQSLTFSVNASVNVLPWSSNQAQVVTAARSVDKAALDRRDARNALAINVVSQYFALRIAGLDLEIAQATQKLREGQVRAATAQQSAGQITREQLLQQQQNLETARAGAQQATGALEVARLQLANTLGVAANPNWTASSLPTEPKLPAGSLETIIKSALEKRGDVQKASISLRDAEDTLAAARFDRAMPDTSVRLGYGQQGNAQANASLNFKTGAAGAGFSYTPVNINAGPNTPPTNLTVTAAISLPIIAPSSEAKIASAELNLENAKRNLTTVRRSAELDVRQRYSDASTGLARVGTARAAQALSAQAFETAKARFDAGLNTALDVESARINKQQSDRDLDNAISNAQIGVYRLENATGSLNLVNPQ